MTPHPITPRTVRPLLSSADEDSDTIVLGLFGALKGVFQRHPSHAIVGAAENMAAHRSALDAANDEWRRLHGADGSHHRPG